MNKSAEQTSFDTLLACDFLEMINDAFFFLDYSLHFVFVNKKAEQIVGKTKNELQGKKVTEVFPEVKQKAIYFNFLKKRKFNKNPFEYYSPAMKKWLSIKVHPTLHGIGVCAQDITNLKHTKDKIKEKQNIIDAFFDHSPVALIIYDEQMNFLKMDTYSAKTYWGKKSSEMIGKPLAKFSPDNAKALKPSFQRILTENKAIYTELPIYDKLGNLHYVASSRFPLTFNNGKHGVGSISLDITERVISEKRKDDFIAMASHELKTPLTTAKIVIQVLQKRFGKKVDSDSQHMLKKVEDKINQLNLLVKELLDASLANRGKIIVKKEKFIFRDLATQIVADLQMSTKHKLIVHWETNEYLDANKGKVSQILANFILNAIKYSPEEKDIIIRSQKNGDFIVVSVEDFGIGIPKEDQPYIFDRFYQSNNHNTYPGLGLGLYIAKEIIMQIGGQIWLESSEGKGSTFYFSLPIYKEEKK